MALVLKSYNMLQQIAYWHSNSFGIFYVQSLEIVFAFMRPFNKKMPNPDIEDDHTESQNNC